MALDKGRNLIRNSKGDSLTDWITWGAGNTTLTNYLGHDWIWVVKADSNNQMGVHTPTFNLKANKTYICSFTIRSRSNSGYDLNYLYLRQGDTNITSIKSLPNVNMRDSKFEGDIAGDGLRVWFTFRHEEDVKNARILLAISDRPDGAGFVIRETMVTEGAELLPYAPAPEDSYLDHYLKSTVTYAHAKLKIDDYWNRGITGQGVKIAAIDDAIFPHEALNIAGGYACGTLTSYIGNSDHATHCAGIATARNLQNGQPTGIAPDVEYYHIRMYHRTFADRIYSLIEAIDYCIDTGIDILSMSIHIAENSSNYGDGRGSSQGTPKHLRIRMREAFFKAYKHGLIIVVAAGNHNDGSGEDNIEFEELLPKMPNVVTVANLTPINSRRDTSGVGKWVDVAGYGTWIKSTLPGDRYGLMTGTSMATPQIAGIFALYKQLFSDLTSQEVIEKMFANCEKVSGLNSDQQGRGVPQPPSDLYEIPVLETADNQFRVYKEYTWKATESYAKINGEWIEMEAMGRG